MATAQTMQQRSSLDLALANPVYQGGWRVEVCSSASTAGLRGFLPGPARRLDTHTKHKGVTRI
jgi:hypothetical protein